MKKFLTLIAGATLLGACATQPKALAPTEENAAKSIAAAETANKKAAAAGFEWRDTGKMLKQAKEAAAKKDYAKAIELAQRAERQGENALNQAANAAK